MKAGKKLIAVSLLASTLLFAQNGYNNQSQSDYINLLPVYELTQTQIDDMLFMFEEEKMARDVYMYAYDTYGASIFTNIANSEQHHMDSMALLLTKYNIALPDSTQGVFSNADINALYNTLIDKVNISYEEALAVGVLVEKTDIEDLEKRLEGATEDTRSVYESLLNGSYNHLSSFEALVNGESATPPQIPSEELNTTTTTCEKIVQEAGENWSLLGTPVGGCDIGNLESYGAKKSWGYGNGKWATEGTLKEHQGFWIYK